MSNKMISPYNKDWFHVVVPQTEEDGLKFKALKAGSQLLRCNCCGAIPVLVETGEYILKFTLSCFWTKGETRAVMYEAGSVKKPGFCELDKFTLLNEDGSVNV